MARQPDHWAVIPAAGTGVRMGLELPKQYLKIHGKYVLEYALERFCRHPRITGVVVARARQDTLWNTMTIATHDKLGFTLGGSERCHSVLNGIEHLRARAAEDDWVLVHDAARPCLSAGDLDLLLDTLEGHPCGGILALPVRDTMKRSGPDREITETVSREGLWHALTPQMFRLGALHAALHAAIDAGVAVTDEAQAMERAGQRPLLVQGRPDNIKITRPEDLRLAELFLGHKENH